MRRCLGTLANRAIRRTHAEGRMGEIDGVVSYDPAVAHGGSPAARRRSPAAARGPTRAARPTCPWERCAQYERVASGHRPRASLPQFSIHAIARPPRRVYLFTMWRMRDPYFDDFDPFGSGFGGFGGFGGFDDVDRRGFAPVSQRAQNAREQVRNSITAAAHALTRRVGVRRR